MKKAKISKEKAKVVEQSTQGDYLEQTVVKEQIVNMNFSLQVAKHVINENLAKSKSFVCSPASMDAVLRILASGAKNSTLVQLLDLLGHTDVRELKQTSSKLAEALKGSDDEGGPDISYVNALWLDKRFPLKAKFEKVLRKVHNAHARTVDFVDQREQAVKVINAWAEQETKGLIKQILTENHISKDAALVLTNALYFKGDWQKSFKATATGDSHFNLLDGHKVRVPFMNQRGERFDYGAFNECQVIRMPYKRGKYLNDIDSTTKTFSMHVFLPFEKDGLLNFMDKIKIDENMFNDQVKLDIVEVEVLSIPKFKFKSEVSLIESMKQLGLTLPFEEECRDFSRIIHNRDPLYVSDILQKCCVETNEIGTKAATVTRLELPR